MTEEDVHINTIINVRKLESKEHFEQIQRANLENIQDWIPYYPNHRTWVNNVIHDLNTDSHSRIAFGGFFHNFKTNKNEFCCSAIVKKNEFSEYLEIKNLMVFNVNSLDNTINDKSNKVIKRAYKRQVISYIKNFCQYRGYPKLVTELSKKKDRELINVFLESDFVLSGSQFERYNRNDEVVFLSHEVNLLYGLDPYDNYRSSIWLLSKYLSAQNITSIEKPISLNVDFQDKRDIPFYSFFTGKKYNDTIKNKFNNENYLIVFEENFTGNINLDFIESTIKNGLYLKTYLFDYTKGNLSRSLSSNIKKNFTIFERSELDQLMGIGSQSIKGFNRKRFDFEGIGGLLLISDPKRFPLQNAINLLDQNSYFIYIKLGDYGAFIDDTMPVAFAYYPENSDRTTLQVWGIGKLMALPSVVNINSLKEEQFKNRQPEKKFTSSDAEILFDSIQDILNDGETDEFNNLDEKILWSKDDFNKHNRYNETNRVIIYIINELKTFPLNNGIDSTRFLEDSNYLESLENIFDFYLSKKEAHKLLEFFPNQKSKTSDDSIPHTVTLKYIHAMPNDALRPGIDFGEIAELQKQNTQKLTILTPILDANYKKLIKEFGEKFPTIIHYSGHGLETALKLKSESDGNTEFLFNSELNDVFKDDKGGLKLVILNSCFSSEQAEIISKNQIYAIGFLGDITPDEGTFFSRHFYEGFLSKSNLGWLDAIKIGCRNVRKANITLALKIGIWKDGENLIF